MIRLTLPYDAQTAENRDFLPLCREAHRILALPIGERRAAIDAHPTPERLEYRIRVIWEARRARLQKTTCKA